MENEGGLKILIVNGPNLNLLGKRDVTHYGARTFDEFLVNLKTKFPAVQIDFFQSNVEGEIIQALHDADTHYDGVLLNAAAYTHTSVGIGDAVEAVNVPVVEVHISNIWNREGFRQKSFIAPHARGHITGFGLDGYTLGIWYFVQAKMNKDNF